MPLDFFQRCCGPEENTKYQIDKIGFENRVDAQRIADEVDKRTVENADIYKKRQRLAEHPFGTVKRDLDFHIFLQDDTKALEW